MKKIILLLSAGLVTMIVLFFFQVRSGKQELNELKRQNNDLQFLVDSKKKRLEKSTVQIREYEGEVKGFKNEFPLEI